MMVQDLVIIGAGGHARTCIDAIESISDFRIAGLVGGTEQKGSQLFGYPILGSDEDLEVIAKTIKFAFIGAGQIYSSSTRERLFHLAVKLGFTLPTIISRSAVVSRHAKLGAGTLVAAGAIVNAGAVVGQNCIINSRSLIEHDCRVGDHCHISTGAILNGNVSVGRGSFIGSGSIVKNGILITDNVFVRMSSTVIDDITTVDTVRSGH